jgi:hypothetical protein
MQPWSHRSTTRRGYSARYHRKIRRAVTRSWASLRTRSMPNRGSPSLASSTVYLPAIAHGRSFRVGPRGNLFLRGFLKISYIAAASMIAAATYNFHSIHELSNKCAGGFPIDWCDVHARGLVPPVSPRCFCDCRQTISQFAGNVYAMFVPFSCKVIVSL